MAYKWIKHLGLLFSRLVALETVRALDRVPESEAERIALGKRLLGEAEPAA